MNTDLTGKTALVTGASSGIGLATARALLDAGCRVICTARRTAPMEAAFSSDANARVLALDVIDDAALAALPGSLPEGWREVDVLFANAGSDLGGRAHFLDGPVADYRNTMAVNINGVVGLVHALLPGMLARGKGDIVVTGSVAALATYAGGSIYAASKHAVHAFCDGLRKDLANDPIRLIEIMPGTVKTGFAAARRHGDEAQGDAFYDAYPAVLSPEDIAQTILSVLALPQHINVDSLVVRPTGDKG
ncbi:MAG: SDR family oxidoreductase [Alphaproteobacteria bacterium]